MTNLRKRLDDTERTARGFPSFGPNRQETLLMILAESRQFEDMIYSLVEVKKEISGDAGGLSFHYERINKLNAEGRLWVDAGIYQIVKARDNMVTAIDRSLELVADRAIGSPYTEPDEVIWQLTKIRDETETILIREYGWTMQTLESEGHKTDRNEMNGAGL